MTTPRYPSLYQINTRVWLTELSGALGKRATLDDIPDVELDRLAQMGFDWIWFLSVWQTGEERLLVAVNYAGNQSQCYLRLSFTDLGKARWQLKDEMGDAVYTREGDDLQSRGLYLDVPPWQASVFSLKRVT